MPIFYFNIRLLGYFKTLDPFCLFSYRQIISTTYSFEISRDITFEYVLDLKVR